MPRTHPRMLTFSKHVQFINRPIFQHCLWTIRKYSPVITDKGNCFHKSLFESVFSLYSKYPLSLVPLRKIPSRLLLLTQPSAKSEPLNLSNDFRPRIRGPDVSNLRIHNKPCAHQSLRHYDQVDKIKYKKLSAKVSSIYWIIGEKKQNCVI